MIYNTIYNIIHIYNLNLQFHIINDEFQAIPNFHIVQLHLLLRKFDITMAFNCSFKFL